MKPALLIIGILVSGMMIYTIESGELFSESLAKNRNEESYTWQQVLFPGSGRFPEKWEDGKWPMGINPVIAFDNKLWMIGQEKSWSSENGLEWNSHPKADWGERHGMSVVFFNDRLWVSGGMKNWGDFRNDCWVSPDGKNWSKVAEHAPWHERIRHKTIVFRNKLWLIGGTIGSGIPDQLPTQFLNDVWSSEDGVTWKLEMEHAPWLARHDPKVFVFDNYLWILGGSGKIGGAGKTDIWRSADGKNWTQILNRTPWKERTGNGVLVFDNRIWIFGGVDRNDVWYSSDGIQWEQLNEHAPWTTRTTDCSIVFQDNLWVFGGKTGREDSWNGEVWTMTKK